MNPGGCPPVTFDLEPYRRARAAESAAARKNPRILLLPVGFGGLGAFFVGLGATALDRSPSVGATLTLFLGMLLGLICAVWVLIIWAPGFPESPTALVAGGDGLRLEYPSGRTVRALWKDANPPVCLLDLRTSVVKFKVADQYEQTRLRVYAKPLVRQIPITVEGSEQLLHVALAAGFLPIRYAPGDWHVLPRGVRLQLEFKMAVVAFLPANSP